MFKCSVPSLVLCATLTLASAVFGQESSTNKAAGVVAIHAGKAPYSEGFKGSGFLIGDGWVATAKHVVDAIDGDFFVTISTVVPTSNEMQVTTKVHCPAEDGDNDVDICFFELDRNDELLRRDFAKPFQVICPPENQEIQSVNTLGFINYADEIHGPLIGNIVNKGGRGKIEGVTHYNLIHTDAPTTDGMSGGPVYLPGSRRVIGVHSAFDRNNQLVTPFRKFELPFKGILGGVPLCEGSVAPVQSLKIEDFCLDFLAEAGVDCSIVPSENAGVTESDLTSLGEIWTALQAGQGAGICRDERRVLLCLEKIDAELSAMKENGSGGSLLDLTEFIRSLRELESAFELLKSTGFRAKSLDQLAVNYSHLKFDSSAFSSFFDSDNALETFLRSAGLNNLPISSAFFKSYPHYRDGRIAVHQGRLSDGLDEFIKVDDPPDFFQLYLDPLILNLRIQTGRVDAQKAEDGFLKYSSEVGDSDFFSAALIGNTSIYFLERFSGNADEAAVSIVVRRATRLWEIAGRSPSKDILGADIQLARFFRASKKTHEATEIFETTFEKVFKNEDSVRDNILAAVSALHYIATDNKYNTFRFDSKTYFEHLSVTSRVRHNFACALWNHPDFDGIPPEFKRAFNDTVRRIHKELENKLECIL